MKLEVSLENNPDDYDGLTMGMMVQVRAFGNLASFGAVNGWTHGDNCVIIGFVNDGRVVIQTPGGIVSQDLAQSLGFPIGTLVISRGSIATIINQDERDEKPYMFPHSSHAWISKVGMINKRCQRCGAYSNLSSGYMSCPKNEDQGAKDG